MRRILVLAVLVVSCLPSLAAAQRAACGGHRIHWIGGAPGLAFDRGPRDHTPPVYEEPAGMDRDLWDALVFDAYDRPVADPARAGGMAGVPLTDRRTLAIDQATVPNINICIQSSDESYTGERLAAYTGAAWWTRNIRRWTNLGWSGEIRSGACRGDPPSGWLYVREGDVDDFSDLPDNTLAGAWDTRYFDPHSVRGGRWVSGLILWHPDRVRDMRSTDVHVEATLNHELGHILGFWHAPPASGFVMTSPAGHAPPDTERWLAQWAYVVGPNVQYPGLVRVPPVPALPLVGLVLLAGLLGVVGRRLYIRTLN